MSDRSYPGSQRILIALLIVLASLLPLGQPLLPAGIGTAQAADGGGAAEQEARRLAIAYLEAFNSGDPAVMLAFQKRSLTPEALSRRPEDERRHKYQEMWDELGRLEQQKIIATEGGVKVTARSAKSGEVLQVDLGLSAGSPPRIERIGIMIGGDSGPALDLPEAGLRAGMGAAEVARALDGWLADLARRDLFSGVVLLAEGDQVLFEKAYGAAARDFDVPNGPGTRFNVGSIGKSFTKVAIGQLAASGRLSLDDTIARHLPDYPNAAIAGKVTIRQLLRHAGGLGDFFGQRYVDTPKDRIRELADYIALFAEDPLLFEPGSSTRYSNAGYVVLGRIIEKISGQTYPEYLAEHVFTPAGMKDSGFFDLDVPTPNRAVGYTRQSDGSQDLRESSYLQPARGSSAGGGYATARDLLRFDRAVRAGQLLPAAWSAWALGGPEPGKAPGEATAAGAGGAPLGIAGGSPGWNAVIESNGHGAIVVVANIDPPVAEAIAQRIRPVFLHEGD